MPHRDSDQHAMDYLRSFYNGRPVQYSYGEPQIAGRPFYNDDFTAAELHRPAQARLDEVLRRDRRRTCGDAAAADVLRGLAAGRRLPARFRAENDLDLAAHGIDAPAQHLDRQSHHCLLPLRRAEQHGLLRDRHGAASPCFRRSRSSTSIPGRSSRRRAGRPSASVDFAHPDFEQVSAFPRSACRRADAPSWNPATRSSSRACGGTTSRDWSAFNVLVNYWWSSVAGVHSDADARAVSR